MKKLFVFLIAAVMIISAGASAFTMISSARNNEAAQSEESDSADQEEVRDAVVQYLKNLKSSDFDAAYANVAQDAQDAFDLRSKQESILETAQDLDESVQKAAQEYFSFMCASLVRSYSIDEISVSNQNASASVTIFMYDPDDVKDLDEETLDSYMEDYYEEHYDELNELYNNEGEDAVSEELNLQSYLYSYQTMKEYLKDAQSLEKQIQIDLELSDQDQWLITGISFA